MPADDPLGSLHGGLPTSEGERPGMRRKLIRDVVTWLKTDEHALAGGLASKLSEAEGRAIKLLTPPKPVTPKPTKPEPQQPESGRTRGRWSVRVGKSGCPRKEWSTTVQELLPEAGG